MTTFIEHASGALRALLRAVTNVVRRTTRRWPCLRADGWSLLGWWAPKRSSGVPSPSGRGASTRSRLPPPGRRRARSQPTSRSRSRWSG